MEREQEIAELKEQMEEIKSRLSYLYRRSIVDVDKLSKFFWARGDLAKGITAVARCAVTPREEAAKPVKVQNMTDRQYEVAKELADKIADLFCEAREKEAWK